MKWTRGRVENHGGQIPPYIPVYDTYADLPNDVGRPVLLNGIGVVYRDPRTEGQMWVPWWLSEATLKTSWHYSTVNLASLPSGWIIAASGGDAAITGGSGSIVRIKAANAIGSLAYLQYTLSRTGHKAAIVRVNGYAETIAGSSNNYGAVNVYDTRQNKAYWWILDYQNSGASYLCNVAEGCTGFTGSTHPIMGIYPEQQTSADRMLGVALNDPDKRLATRLNTTTASSDWIHLRANCGVAVGEVSLYVESCAVYEHG